jgi:hypothetical protein
VMPLGFSSGYKPTKRTLRRTDLPALLAACSSDQQRAWICLSLAIGGDKVDIESARPEDYDRERQVIHVHGTKTGHRDAEIPVMETTRELLEYALPHMPIRWKSASNNLGRVCKRAGIPHLSPKDLRRTASSWMLADGVPQSLISRWLRHANDTMVRTTYGQLTADELGRLIAESGTPPAQSLLGRREHCSAGVTIPQDSCCKSGVQGRNRTSDTRIFKPVHGDRADERGGFDGSFYAIGCTNPREVARRRWVLRTPASQGLWLGRKAA